MPKSLSERPDTQVTPEPVLEKRSRRTFKPEYKLRIMAEAGACKHGELGALLRRENCTVISFSLGAASLLKAALLA